MIVVVFERYEKGEEEEDVDKNVPLSLFLSLLFFIIGLFY